MKSTCGNRSIKSFSKKDCLTMTICNFNTSKTIERKINSEDNVNNETNKQKLLNDNNDNELVNSVTSLNKIQYNNIMSNSKDSVNGKKIDKFSEFESETYNSDQSLRSKASFG